MALRTGCLFDVFEGLRCLHSAFESRFEVGLDRHLLIDRNSSAEPFEAINSVFAWYSGAIECYAYPPDVIWEKDKIEVSRKRLEASK